MKSKASIKSHPLHPIMVTLPIGLLIGTLIFDILALLTENTDFWQTGTHTALAGIITGLLAAVPGIIDYLNTVPPDSSAKKRATKHGLLNVIVIIVFSVCYAIRVNDDSSSWTIGGLEFLAIIGLGISGWLGGTLVHANQIGVSNRYANSGKWKEQHFGDASGLIEVAATNELKVDQMKLLFVNKKRIVLGRTETGYVAFNNRCTHKGGSLAGGMMICGTVQCPWHGSQFDCRSGEVKAGPANEQIETYQVTETAGKIYLHLSR